MLKSLLGRYRRLTADSRFREILTGAAWSLPAYALATLLTLGANIFVARFYGAESVGALAIIQSIVLFASMFTVFGTATSIMRLIPEQVRKYSASSAYAVYRKIIFLICVASIVVCAPLWLLSDFISENLLSKPHLGEFLAIAAGFVIFKSLVDVNVRAIRGLRLIRVFAVMQVLPMLAMLAILITGTIFFDIAGMPIYAQLASWLVAALIGTIIVRSAFSAQIRASDQIEEMPVSEILRISFPMLMTASMHFLIGQTGILMLAAFRTEAEVGYYEIAFKLATLTTFMLVAINSMAGPKLADLHAAGRIDELLYVARKAAKLIFWVTVPVLFVLLAFGRPLLEQLFGLQFVKAYPALTLLVVGQFINAISGSTGLFMNMTGHQVAFRNIVFSAGVINIVVNLILTPRYGIVGAACASMLSISIWNVSTLVFTKRVYGRSIGYVPGFIKTDNSKS